MRYERGDTVMHYKTTVIILALASAALGADTSPSPTQGTHVKSPTNSVTVGAKDYTFTIQTDKDTYDPDEKVVLAIKVKYTGVAPVYFDTSAAPFFGNITVLRKGMPCPQTLFYKDTVSNGFSYGKGVQPYPGWEHTYSFHLNRLFDTTQGDEYKIWVKRQVTDKEAPSGNTVIDCGPITIHIRPGSEIIENK